MAKEKDILNPCGHRNSERLKALMKFPSAVCPACLLEQIEGLEIKIQRQEKNIDARLERLMRTIKDKQAGRIKELEAGQLNFAKEMDRIHSNNLKRIKELEELLIEYGRHSEGCPAQFNVTNKKYRCRCGWDREKQALKG